jgi:hypothetical protein
MKGISDSSAAASQGSGDPRGGLAVRSPPPLTDSPWFWAYAFATFALVLLVLIGPKFQQRRTLEERSFQGRARAMQQRLGEEPSVPLSTPAHTWLSLKPLYFLLGGMIAVAWGRLWWQRWRPTRAAG